MLSQLIPFAQTSLFQHPLMLIPLLIGSPQLAVAGIAVYRDTRSYWHQGKRWIWYKRPSAIDFFIFLTIWIGFFLSIAPIVTVNMADIDKLPANPVFIEVLLSMPGFALIVIGSGALVLYRQSLIKQEKKEEQT